MGGKGKTSEKTKTLEKEESKKREEDARRLVQEAEGWLKNEEEEKEASCKGSSKEGRG